MTSPDTPKSTTPADDGVPSPDDVPLTLGETESKDDKTPSSAPFTLLGPTDAEACGPDGCAHP